VSQRYVLTVELKDDPAVVDAYIRYHRDVWPEVQASLRRVGVQQMDIYLLGRRLVMVVDMDDGLDYRVAFRAHAASSPRVAEWERLMKSLQQPAAEARAGESWAVMESVFHLDVEKGSDPSRSRSTEQQEPAIADIADPSHTS
jgi:L-rhamnose mutarotase